MASFLNITTFESHAGSYAIFGVIDLSSAISAQIRFLYSTPKICIVDICVFWSVKNTLLAPVCAAYVADLQANNITKIHAHIFECYANMRHLPR